jgi:hypothetical protein
MGSPRFTPPWSLDEIRQAQEKGPIPPRVLAAMYTAAWARAEHCPLNVIAGRLEPHCRYEPTEALWAAFGQAQGEIIGALGFGVPILVDDKRRAFAASWRLYWERN